MKETVRMYVTLSKASHFFIRKNDIFAIIRIFVLTLFCFICTIFLQLQHRVRHDT